MAQRAVIEAAPTANRPSGVSPNASESTPVVDTWRFAVKKAAYSAAKKAPAGRARATAAAKSSALAAGCTASPPTATTTVAGVTAEPAAIAVARAEDTIIAGNVSKPEASAAFMVTPYTTEEVAVARKAQAAARGPEIARWAAAFAAT
jgi:hypothetical protein